MSKNKAKIKKKKAEKRKQEEAKIAQHLLSCGWKQSGPYGEVWSISEWDGPGFIKKTLRQAYKLQHQLDAKGFVKAVSADDDLFAD